MKFITTLLLAAFVVSCSNSTEPEKPTVFYKSINKDLFPGELYINVSTYEDTIHYQNAYIQTITAPQIELTSDVKQLSFWHNANIIVSSSLDFTDTLGGQYMSAGSFGWKPGFNFTYKCKNEKEKIICIRLKCGEQVYFTVGIDLSKIWNSL